MKSKIALLAIIAAVGVAIAAVAPATAQGMQDNKAPGMMQGDTERSMMDHGMMRGGEAMDQCMMRNMGSMTMRHQMDRGTMMGSTMMNSGMMQHGSTSGISALFGSRVTPIMNLSVEDVRGYLTLQLQQINNKRLKIGDLKADEGTITADIVTVDNSLVQRLKIDRHTGAIEYER